MLNPDTDLLESNVQLNLLNFNQKIIAMLNLAGRSADQPTGLFGQHFHLSRRQYQQLFPDALNGPQLPVLPALDPTKSSARYRHQLITAAINLQIAATSEVLTWLLQTVGPTIRAALFDPLQGGHANVAIVDVVDYLELHHSSLSSQDIFALNDILNAYNSELSMAANFVKWDTVYATYTSHNISTYCMYVLLCILATATVSLTFVI